MRLEFAVLQNNSSLKGTCEPEGCKKETLTFLTRSKLDQYYFYWFNLILLSRLKETNAHSAKNTTEIELGDTNPWFLKICTG